MDGCIRMGASVGRQLGFLPRRMLMLPQLPPPTSNTCASARAPAPHPPTHAGLEFDDLRPPQQSDAVGGSLAVFSRVEPSHKTRLVELLRSQVGGWVWRGAWCCVGWADEGRCGWGLHPTNMRLVELGGGVNDGPA